MTKRDSTTRSKKNRSHFYTISSWQFVVRAFLITIACAVIIRCALFPVEDAKAPSPYVYGIVASVSTVIVCLYTFIAYSGCPRMYNHHASLALDLLLVLCWAVSMISTARDLSRVDRRQDEEGNMSFYEWRLRFESELPDYKVEDQVIESFLSFIISFSAVAFIVSVILLGASISSISVFQIRKNGASETSVLEALPTLPPGRVVGQIPPPPQPPVARPNPVTTQAPVTAPTSVVAQSPMSELSHIPERSIISEQDEGVLAQV